MSAVAAHELLELRQERGDRDGFHHELAQRRLPATMGSHVAPSACQGEALLEVTVLACVPIHDRHNESGQGKPGSTSVAIACYATCRPY